MSRDEAINYLISSGMSQEQIDTVVEALSGKCEDNFKKQFNGRKGQ